MARKRELKPIPLDELLTVAHAQFVTQANFAAMSGKGEEVIEAFEHLATQAVWQLSFLGKLIPFEWQRAEQFAETSKPDTELLEAERHLEYLHAERRRLKRLLILPPKRKSRAKRLPIAA